MRHLNRPYNEPGLTLLERLIRYHRTNLREVSRKTEISRTTLQRIVKGQYPDVRAALRIAHYFNVKVEDIWRLEDTEEPRCFHQQVKTKMP